LLSFMSSSGIVYGVRQGCFTRGTLLDGHVLLGLAKVGWMGSSISSISLKRTLIRHTSLLACPHPLDR
jgi:hypothetical protein